VADAAAGSYYVENLTRELAGRAWGLFRQVEAEGGLAASLESGFVQAELRRTAEERESALALRQEKITGVSVFPRLAEALPGAASQDSLSRPRTDRSAHALSLPQPGKGERFAALAAAARQGATLSELRHAAKSVADFAGPRLATGKRDAEPFEILRRQSDLALANVGSRPPIFLARLGKPEDYRARENWVRGFFAAGGIEVVAPEHSFDSIPALVTAFKQSPAPAACLCSSNAGYGAMIGAAAALKKAGAVFLYLAGPAAMLKRLDPSDASAVDRLVYEGCDAIAVLQETHKVLRVEDLSAVADDEGDDT
jgi:methylmalonyl-CoA mutase